MPVMELNTVEDTALWKQLANAFTGNDDKIAKLLATNLTTICQEAYNRMRNFPSLHPEYTLHDQVHLLRVTELMSKIIPSEVFTKLNPVEIALLILSAHFHDQGMVLERDEIAKLEYAPDFKKFRENWEIDHPNLRDIKRLIHDRSLSSDEQKRCRDMECELEAALLTGYIRETHGERSANFVRSNYINDPRWIVGGTNLSEWVARLCKSHIQSANEFLHSKDFRHDELIGQYTVNMAYLGLILRLADILDFDRDRTPDALYRTINFRSKVSLDEWAKHRSVEGWKIQHDLIRFTMLCEHPEYQRAAYQFMDWIDKELADAIELCRNFPDHAAHYKLSLPLKVDRSRIEPKDQAYIYHDLEFSLSRDEIIKLLMTNNLYGSPSLCIRELLQNGLDALRHRRALIKRDNGTDWLDGKIAMQHELDQQGHEIIRCIDNGVGMDEEIIERFLTRAGRSYYRSPEFEQERIGFRAAGVDFDPCAQFGIGFMSCFMLGDHIIIRTRRDYGPAKGKGDPLIVEINGIGGIVVIRKGSENQQLGTTVEIIGRKKPRFQEWWQDQVKLTSVLDGYAIACEFPIEAHCLIEEYSSKEIKNYVNFPPGMIIPSTFFETSDIKMFRAIEQDFSEIDPLLHGKVRSSFLVNKDGQFTLNNSEASWQPPGIIDGKTKNTAYLAPELEALELNYSHFYENQTCIDGILVAGEPGREKRQFMMPSYSNPIKLDRIRFTLDIRGQIKPPLTPARTRPEGKGMFNSYGPKWDYIQMLADRAVGRIWEKVAAELNNSLSSELFWQLAIIYGHQRPYINNMRSQFIWDSLSLPVIFEDGRNEWIPIAQLGVINPQTKTKNEIELLVSKDGKIDAYHEISKWMPENFGQEKFEMHGIKDTAISMSTVIAKNNQIYLEIRPPVEADIIPNEFQFPSDDGPLMLLPYAAELREYFSVFMPIRSVNRDHPITQLAQYARYIETQSEIQTFATNILYLLSSPNIEEYIDLPKGKITHWPRQIGNEYLDVNWKSVAKELHPPYKIRLKNGNVIEITNADFERWAEG